MPLFEIIAWLYRYMHRSRVGNSQLCSKALIGIAFADRFAEVNMSTQQSQKKGSRSEGQKQMRARDGYDPIPASKAVGGATGKPGPKSHSDKEHSMKANEKKSK